MASAFPGEQELHQSSSQWMDGDLLVAPVLTQSSRKHILLPRGVWYEFGTCQQVVGPREIKGHARLDEIPVYVQAGTVLVLGPIVQYTDALPGGALEVHVYSGDNAVFELVEDDGESKAYESGEVRITKFVWDDKQQFLQWEARGAHRTSKSFTHVKVFLFSPNHRMAVSSERPLDESGIVKHGKGLNFLSK